MTRNQTISHDIANRQLMVRRSFHASQQQLWDAWSAADTRAKWWGQGDWLATSVTFDFTAIDAPNSFTAVASFCNTDGNKTSALSQAEWRVTLSATAPEGPTMLSTMLTFSSHADLQKIINRGFEASYSLGLDRLEALLAAN